MGNLLKPNLSNVYGQIYVSHIIFNEGDARYFSQQETLILTQKTPTTTLTQQTNPNKKQPITPHFTHGKCHMRPANNILSLNLH